MINILTVTSVYFVLWSERELHTSSNILYVFSYIYLHGRRTSHSSATKHKSDEEEPPTSPSIRLTDPPGQYHPPVGVENGGADGALQVADGRVDVGGGGEGGPVVWRGGAGHQQGGRPGGRGRNRIHVSANK